MKGNHTQISNCHRSTT